MLFKGKVSAPRSLLGRVLTVSSPELANILTFSLAGLGAGMTEAIFAVTPSETIK